MQHLFRRAAAPRRAALFRRSRTEADEVRVGPRASSEWALGAAAVVAGSALLMAGAAPAAADTDFDAQLAAARGSCAPLQHDPLVARVAQISNQSTLDYLNHSAQHVPVADPLLVLRDLGGAAGRGVQLQGYASDGPSAIRGALLQGHAALPDCGYTTFGTSMIHDTEGNRVLVVAVLAGP